jgi:hypothetical protein
LQSKQNPRLARFANMVLCPLLCLSAVACGGAERPSPATPEAPSPRTADEALAQIDEARASLGLPRIARPFAMADANKAGLPGASPPAPPSVQPGAPIAGPADTPASTGSSSRPPGEAARVATSSEAGGSKRGNSADEQADETPCARGRRALASIERSVSVVCELGSVEQCTGAKRSKDEALKQVSALCK